jgi:fibronectin type III domain protein
MRKARSLHLLCEMMEDRLVMSTVTFHPTASNFALIEPAKAKPKPAAPSFSITSISTTQVGLSWTKVSGASKYLIEESVNNRWVQLATLSGKATGYTINGLTPNTTYAFDVVYVKGGKHWETSKAATTSPLQTSPTTAPAAPIWTATALSPIAIKLTWSPVPTATDYVISGLNVDPSHPGWQELVTVPGNFVSETINGANPGTTYTFNVSAQNSVGTTAGTPMSVTTPSF